jgi:hypothetical protein
MVLSELVNKLFAMAAELECMALSCMRIRSLAISFERQVGFPGYTKRTLSFDDFSEILWPEKFPEERLKAIQAEFVNEGDARWLQPGVPQRPL